jgi:mannan endo-1,4-beta-mannosidase
MKKNFFASIFAIVAFSTFATAQVSNKENLARKARISVTGGVEMSSSIEAKKLQVLEFLHSISGKKTLTGQHNERFDSIHPFERTEAIYKCTGKYPALFGIDFTYDYRIKGRWSMIYEAERQWHKGALINIMWHACIPTLPEPCIRKEGIQVKMPDSQWQELITDGSVLNLKLKKRLDVIAVYLEYLQSKGVIVLWRPWHEMNQSAFWWGGRPGSEGTSRLYQITHDYLEKTKGLKNLIWVWDVQDLSWNFQDYNPGDKYWDMLALDFYSKEMYTPKKYDAIRKIAGTKPIAIGECGTLPTPETLNKQPYWSFFMAWADLVFSKNKKEEIIELYNDPRMITLDKMPGWNTISKK